MTSSNLVPPGTDPTDLKENPSIFFSPVVKIAAIFGFSIVVLIVLWGQITQKLNGPKTQEVQAQETPIAEDFPISQDDLLRSEVALANQEAASQKAIERLTKDEKAQKRQKVVEATRKGPPNIPSTPPRPSRRVVTRPIPRSAPPVRPSRPVVAPRPIRPQPAPQVPTPAPVIPVASPTLPPVATIQEENPGHDNIVDPEPTFHTFEDAQAIAQLGSYGGVPQALRETQTQETTPYPVLELDIGSELSATLTTPIAWTNQGSPSGQYLARITDGDLQGSLIGLSASADDAGLLTLTPEWIEVSARDRNADASRDRKSLIGLSVLTHNGQPLIAKRRKRGSGGFGRDVLRALTAVGGAAVPGNDRVSTTIINSAEDFIPRDSQSASRDVVWYFKAGQALKIISTGS